MHPRLLYDHSVHGASVNGAPLSNNEPQSSMHVRMQKPVDLQTLVTLANEHVTDSRQGHEYLWTQPSHRGKPSHWNQPPQQRPSTTPRFPLTNPSAQQTPTQNQTQADPAETGQTTQQSPSGPQPQDNAGPKNSRQPHRPAKFFDKEQGPLCFQCKQWGHVGAICPERNVLRVETTRPHETEGLPDLFAMSSILGKPARFFLDSGADHSMVNVNLLNQLKE